MTTDLRDALANARAALDEVDAALATPPATTPGGAAPSQPTPTGMDQLIRTRLGFPPESSGDR